MRRLSLAALALAAMTHREPCHHSRRAPEPARVYAVSASDVLNVRVGPGTTIS